MNCWSSFFFFSQEFKPNPHGITIIMIISFKKQIEPLTRICQWAFRSQGSLIFLQTNISLSALSWTHFKLNSSVDHIIGHNHPPPADWIWAFKSSSSLFYHYVLQYWICAPETPTGKSPFIFRINDKINSIKSLSRDYREYGYSYSRLTCNPLNISLDRPISKLSQPSSSSLPI